MDLVNKYQDEIKRYKRIIKDGQKTMDKVPENMRPYQEAVLNIYRQSLATLERELEKLEGINNLKAGKMLNL